MYATMQEGPSVATARALAARHRASSLAAGQLPVLEDQVCAEAGVWAPDAARRAIAQAGGDVPRAVSLVRVWAATLPHVSSFPVAADDLVVERRVSSAFVQTPGGQWLGIAPDLAPRILHWNDEPAGSDAAVHVLDVHGEPDAPLRSDVPRAREALHDVPVLTAPEDGDGDDPAVVTPVTPYSRATRLGVLARGETASLVTLASLVLGARREAVLTELVAGSAAIRLPHPRTGRPCRVAEIPTVECEVVLDADVGGRPGFAFGWGSSIGHVERRALALALVDGAMQADGDLEQTLSLDDQTVVGATDGSANNGFVEHLRLPHHASFASYVAQARAGVREDS